MPKKPKNLLPTSVESRQRMIDEISGVYKLKNSTVLSAMAEVPREEFVPKDSRHLAYSDNALSIGFGQTISQPYTVAFMTSLIVGRVEPACAGRERESRRKTVLEIGTGSGYQAAVLSKLFDKVYTIEIVPDLAKRARGTFKRLGYKNIEVRVGSGELGWKENALYDAILITANIENKIPPKLFSQLKMGGVLVAPIRGVMTRYIKLKKRGTEELKKEQFGEFSFVPFVA